MWLRHVTRFFLRTPMGAAILVVTVALLVRIVFAAFYVGFDELKHAARPDLQSYLPAGQGGQAGTGQERFSNLKILEGGVEQNPMEAIDIDHYSVFAADMISGKPYHGIRRQPLFPAFHALIFLTFGKHPTLLYNRLAGALLSALGSGAIFLLARRMFGQTVGLIAGLLSVVHINMIHKSGFIYSEVLAIPLFTLTLYFFLAFTDDRKWRQLIFGGLLLGLTSLTRPTTSPFIFLLPLWLWVIYGKINRQMLVRSVVVVALALCMILPWSIYSSVVRGRFLLASNQPWALLCGAYGPAQLEQPLGRNKGLWNPLSTCGLFTAEELEEISNGTEQELEQACKRRFLEYIPTIWHRIPEFMVWRALVFIGFDTRPGAFFVFQAQQLILFVLFLGGLWVERAQWRRLSNLHLAYLFLGVFMILVFYPGSRMRLYVTPIIVAFSATYLVRLVQKWFLPRRPALK